MTRDAAHKAVIDTCAHPFPAAEDDIRRFLPKAWRDRSFPGPEQYQYASPFGEYRRDLRN